MAPNVTDDDGAGLAAGTDANKMPDSSVAELYAWLWERVADERDIVVDDMQEEHFARLEAEDDARDDLPGSAEYRANVEALNTTIAELMKPGCLKALVGEKKQKITDGLKACWYGGTKDKSGRPHGQGMLKYETNDDVFHGTFDGGVLNREGKMSLPGGVAYEGKWKDGLMDGEMRVTTGLGWIEGYWKLGVPHGFQREFGVKDYHDERTPRFVGRYYRGVRRGFCWKGCLGGSFICGVVDKDGEFTGNDIAYIYPDLKMALRGEFDKELFVSARACHVTGFQERDGILVPTFSEHHGRTYCYEHPTKNSIAIHRMTPDPWEFEMVYVGQSKLEQGGEGVFAKRDIPKKKLVSLYNGVRLGTSSYYAKHLGHSDYRICLNADVDLDIPFDCVRLEDYCATLSHKVNHSNMPNTKWVIVEHPRFGVVRGLATTEDIAKDSEILVNYHMNLGDAPEWYTKVWLRHQREFKKLSDNSIERLMIRYREDTGKIINVDLGDRSFLVPDPRGISGLEHLPENEDAGEQQEPVKHTVQNVKKMLKVREDDATIGQSAEGSKIVEIDDDEHEP